MRRSFLVRSLLLLTLALTACAPHLRALSLRERIQQRRILNEGATPEDAAVMRHFLEMASSADIPGIAKELRVKRYNSGTWTDLSRVRGGDWALLNDRSWYVSESSIERATQGGRLEWRRVKLYDNDSSMGDVSLGEYLDHFATGHEHRVGPCRVMLPRRVKFPTVRKVPPSDLFPAGILLYVTKTKEQKQDEVAAERQATARMAAQKTEEARARFERMERIVAENDRTYSEGWKKTAPTEPGRWVLLEDLQAGDVVRIAGQPRVLEPGGSSSVQARKYLWPDLNTDAGVPQADHGYLGPSSYGSLTVKNALERDGKRPEQGEHLLRGVSGGLELADFVSTFRLRRDPARGRRHGLAHFEMFVYPAGSRQAAQARAARRRFLDELSQQQRRFDEVVAPGLHQHHANLRRREENRIASCRSNWVAWFTSLNDCLADRNPRTIMYRPAKNAPIGRPKNSYQPRPSSSGSDPWAKSRNNKIDYTIRKGRGESVGTYNPSVDY